MKKPVNYLASQTEKLSNLKMPLTQHFQETIRLTNLIKQAWQSLLPAEALETLVVYGYDQQTLSISTNSHTLANHLTYQQQSLLQQLHHSQPQFASVIKLNFRVVQLPNSNPTNNQDVVQTTTPVFCESTRENITQLAKFVIDNERLKQQLIRLANS